MDISLQSVLLTLSKEEQCCRLPMGGYLGLAASHLAQEANYLPHHLIIISARFSSWGLVASFWHYDRDPFPAIFSIFHPP